MDKINGLTFVLMLTECYAERIWKGWTSWRCDTTCGEGYERRERNCIYRRRLDDNRLCQGKPTESRYCHISPCEGEIGRTINITCKYNRDYTWYKGREYIGNKRTKYKQNSYYLTIQNLGYSDAGKYYCYHSWLNSGSETQIIVKGSPSIWIKKDKYYAKRGRSKTIRCIPYSNPAITALWWTKSPSDAFLNNPAKYSGGTLRTPDLTINRVDDTDAGEYGCHANNSYGITTATTSVIVRGRPTVRTGKTKYYANKGSSKTIRCITGYSNPSITTLWWTKSPSDAFLNDPVKYSGGTLSTPDLTINKVDDTDAGEYRCHANNAYGITITTTRVIVEGRPTVRTGKTKYYANRGRSKTIRCVTGYSNPPITALWWTKRPSDAFLNDQVKYSGGTLSTSDLIINRVDDTDAGEYRCHANNSYGIATATTRVIVGDVPIVIVPQMYYVRRVDESVTLQCAVQNASIIYWKKGNDILQSGNGKYSRTNVQNISLTISNIETRDSGTYSCIANSLYGEVSKNTELKVIYAHAPTTKFVKRANGTVVLNCTVNDFDRNTWLHNNITLQIQKDDKYSIGNTKRPDLTINNLTRLDRGIYVCQSSIDDLFVRSDTIQLDVEDIPFIQPSQTTFEVIAGNEVLLPCVFDAYPEATEMYWEKDGDKLSDDLIKYNGSSVSRPNLTIIKSEVVDSGIYTCVVRNSIGSGFSGNIQLIVTEHQSTFSVGPVAGVIAGVIVVVVVVLIVAFRLRRKQQTHKGRNKQNGTGVRRTEPYVNVRQSDRQMNTESRNTAAGSGLITRSALVQINTDDSVTYYNMADITTRIKVDDLKNYITTRQTEDLTQQYKRVPYGAHHPTTHAQLKDNIPKNRFKSTFPYDHSRVALEKIKGKANSDYINASFVDGFNKQKCYIASQGPIKTTIEDYWRMIWQENVRNIVMLTNLVEGEKVKCERYWPKGGKTMEVGHLQLVLTVENERAAYITRELSVVNKKTGEKRNIIQYHFTAWPDHGTPDPLYLVLFHKHVISECNTTETGPLLVHCSAGIGRTGTYIALDALLEEGHTTGYIDIFEFLKTMRYCRMNMIQTADQYVCLHFALLEAFTMRDTLIKKECFSKIWHEHKDALHDEFKMLKAQKSGLLTEDYKAALSSANNGKNRSRTVLALDSKRMFLVSFGKGRSDYVNAVHVPSYTRFVGYITTQLPLADTKIDFWTLIKDHDISTVILILEDMSEIELVYSQSDSFSCGPFSIKIKKREIDEHDITEVTLLISRKNDREKQVVLFQLVCKDAPKPADLCRLVNLISTRVSMSNNPVVVVSSDGAKNCGLFCALTNAVSSIQIDKRVDMFQIARLLQLQQPEFFVDIDEYRLWYEALNYYIDTSNVYANI